MVDPTAVTNGHEDGKVGRNVLFVHWSGESWSPRTPYYALVEGKVKLKRCTYTVTRRIDHCDTPCSECLVFVANLSNEIEKGEEVYE